MLFWEQANTRIRALFNQAGGELAKFASRAGAVLRRHAKWMIPAIAILFAGLGLSLVLTLGRYRSLVEERLGSGEVVASTPIYAVPPSLFVGDALSSAELSAQLQQSGYSEDPANRTGHYRGSGDAVRIVAGPAASHAGADLLVRFADGKIASLREHSREVKQARLEPAPITSLSDGNRRKRIVVRYGDLPEHLIAALLSTEDKRFFDHHGLDLLRIAKAAYVDLREGRKEQGASTITMQLARSLWLGQEKTWHRKISEALLSWEIERRFDKKQILEFYANEVYLGQRGSFAIHGLGEGSQAYFGKSVRYLKPVESAMLAGLIQRPAYYNPFRSPERVQDRRNVVLSLMRSNGHLTEAEFQAARRVPLQLRPASDDLFEAPYFIDLVAQQVEKELNAKAERRDLRIHTTLDLGLQRAAVAAVQSGMEEVDRVLKRKRAKSKDAALPQVVLVALDARTGALRALVGGRNYVESQLNRALAKRQPGSSFKPFVYAAAMNTALEKRQVVLTPATLVLDEPTVFKFRDEAYEPGNYGGGFAGDVTLRRALVHSMNIPAIKVAEQVGYRKVVELARRAGVSSKLSATPSLALGSYEMTPIEVAEAYTIFPNAGVHVESYWIEKIDQPGKGQIYAHEASSKPALDPRAAYLTLNMLEDVLWRGTGAGVRSRGFALPAAGKTGTSRDGWFAGFTSELICVVWVGYDDHRELDLEGSKSALPVWTEFMKRAHRLGPYRSAKAFNPPRGIVKVEIDPESGMLPTSDCSDTTQEYFIAGSEPVESCFLHGGTPLGERPGILGRVLDVFR